MKKLIGREREIKELARCIASDQSEFVIVYGRRRVGKTFLVDEYFKRSYDFSYVGGHNLSNAKQLRNFAKAIKRYARLPTDIAKQKNWIDPNGVIANWMRNRNTVEFLGIWETLYNPNFNPLEFEGIRKEAGFL